MSLQDDLSMLGLDAELPEADLKVVYKQRALETHPDKRDGDDDEFIDVKQAYERLLARARRPRRCQPCNGTGKMQINQGFHTINRRCPHCRGEGVKVLGT